MFGIRRVTWLLVGLAVLISGQSAAASPGGREVPRSQGHCHGGTVHLRMRANRPLPRRLCVDRRTTVILTTLYDGGSYRPRQLAVPGQHGNVRVTHSRQVTKDKRRTAIHAVHAGLATIREDLPCTIGACAYIELDLRIR